MVCCEKESYLLEGCYSKIFLRAMLKNVYYRRLFGYKLLPCQSRFPEHLIRLYFDGLKTVGRSRKCVYACRLPNAIFGLVKVCQVVKSSLVALRCLCW